ncbi:MAG TPA: methylamine utilization protein [Gemmatimonadales bacterium]|nr:methylamine utilization protein [Gemmatimonadales bacterium]
MAARRFSWGNALTVLGTVALLLGPIPAAGNSISASVRDSAGGPVVDAVVYASPTGGAAQGRPPRNAVIEQTDRDFIPFVTVIQVGSAISFPNRDPLKHQIYSFSPAKPFEIKLYSGKTPPPIVFDKPGVVALGCNIHDWMEAYVFVVETPHFAKADKNGAATITDLPAGRYRVQVWHPDQRSDAAGQEISVGPKATAHAEFAVDLITRQRKPKPPFDPLNYGERLPK